MMNKTEIENVLIKAGWVKDRWGNFKKDVKVRGSTRLYRIKLQDKVVRVEHELDLTNIPGGKKEWVRSGGGYYKDCHQYCEGVIRLGTIKLRVKESQ